MARIRIGGREHAGISYKGITIKYEGHTPEEIADALNRLGYLPPAALSTPVRRSASAVQRLARGHAPRLTGALIVGLVVGKREHSSKPGKVVYDVRFAKEMDMAFAKISKKTGKRAYYPASMEYGFRTRDGKRYAGKYYLRDASTELMPYHEQLLLDSMWSKIMAIWAKENGTEGTTP